jgi:hypothetical protein
MNGVRGESGRYAEQARHGWMATEYFTLSLTGPRSADLINGYVHFARSARNRCSEPEWPRQTLDDEDEI